jgi:hypothetical protein
VKKIEEEKEERIIEGVSMVTVHPSMYGNTTINPMEQFLKI